MTQSSAPILAQASQNGPKHPPTGRSERHSSYFVKSFFGLEEEEGRLEAEELEGGDLENLTLFGDREGELDVFLLGV